MSNEMYNLIFAISKTNDDGSGRARSCSHHSRSFAIFIFKFSFTLISSLCVYFHSFLVYSYFLYFSFFFAPCRFANDFCPFEMVGRWICACHNLYNNTLNTLNAIWAVSFSGNGNNIVVGTRNEAISLSTLDRDCFIIPVHSLDRFLPAGIPVSQALSILLFFVFFSFKSFLL